MIDNKLTIDNYIEYIKNIGKAMKATDINELNDSLIRISGEIFAEKKLFRNNNLHTKTQFRVVLNLLRQIVLIDMIIKYSPEVTYKALKKNHLSKLII